MEKQHTRLSLHQLVGSYFLYLLVKTGISSHVALIAAIMGIMVLVALIHSLEGRLRKAVGPAIARLSGHLGTFDRASFGASHVHTDR